MLFVDEDFMGVVLRSLVFRANVPRAVVLRRVAIGVRFLKSVILLGQDSQVLQVLTILSTKLPSESQVFWAMVF